ncbi:MAG: HAD family phosphatase [Dongiaceae bacterium]
MTGEAARRGTVVFDLGGVLIDWNPRHLYRKLFPGDEAAMEDFLANVCSPDWNERQDEGRSFADAAQHLIERHPEKRHLIEAYGARFGEMLAGAIPGTVLILEELHRQGTPLYALTNWSAETYPIALERFEFLQWFRGVVVSGHEKLIKPDPRIYRLLLERFAIDAADAVYIDDNPRNAEAATRLGLHGIHFTGPAKLREALVGLRILPAHRGR